MGYQNFFATKLFTDIGAADATIALETPPTVTSGRLVFEARNSTQKEIVKYTGVSGSSITGVLRGQGGTTAKAHVKNSLVEMNATGEDLQDILDAFTSFSASQNDWFSIPQSIGTIVNLTQKSYTVPVLGVDLRGSVQLGTRIKATRTVVPPLVQGRFNYLTSQHADRATTTGMGITDTITVSAKVNLSGYRNQVIASARGTNSGWDFYLFADGSLRIHGNLSSGNYKLFQTKQAYPLNKDVTITVKLQMSTNTAACFFDGVPVAMIATNSGTANSMTAVSNLNVGWDGTSSAFLDGSLQDLAIYNTYLADNLIIDRLDKTLAGNETGLVAYYRFNETSGTTVNDLTTNANHLTATASSVLNNTGNQFKAIEMGIVTDIQYTGGNSILTVLAGNNFSFPTTGGMTGLYYSNRKNPIGFPMNPDLWSIDMTWYGASAGGAPVTTTNNNAAWQPIQFFSTVIPRGGWKMDWRGMMTAASGAAGTHINVVEFSDVNTGDATRPYHRQNWQISRYPQGATATSYNISNLHGSEEWFQAAAATYQFYSVVTGGSGTCTTYFETSSVRVKIVSSLL